MASAPSRPWDLEGARSSTRAFRPHIFIEQQVAPLFYSRTRAAKGPHEVFTNENEFWDRCGSLTFQSVTLDSFQLSDWFPRAPGVYWSRHGVQAREYTYAEKPQHDPALGLFYSPQSKMSLIEEGGIGTIRLRPRRIDNIDCWLGTAVKGSQCAGGIPLAIPDAFIHEAKVEWGDTVTIRGTVRFLQDVGLKDTAAYVHHSSPLIVLVEHIKNNSKRKQLKQPIIITPVVLFEETGKRDAARGSRQNHEFGYAFVQCAANSDDELQEAGNWIETYAERHGGHVITNFDEQRPLLSNAPLSYQRLVKQTYDRTVIEHLYFNGPKLADRIDNVEEVMSVSVTLGDGTVVHGDFIVANSIKDSFNRVKESVADEKLKEALETLSSQVGSLVKTLDTDSAQKTADALETLTKEAAREKPRREWLELSLKTIKDVATSVRDIGKPIIETITAIGSLLAIASS